MGSGVRLVRVVRVSLASLVALGIAACSLEGLSDGFLPDSGQVDAFADVVNDVAPPPIDSTVDAAAAADGPFLDTGNPECGVHLERHRRLYCTHIVGAYLYPDAVAVAGGQVDNLGDPYSYFDCWGTGALHDGGNHTWYNAQGDLNKQRGWMAASDLDTTPDFDKDPSAYGMLNCAVWSDAN